VKLMTPRDEAYRVPDTWRSRAPHRPPSADRTAGEAPGRITGSWLPVTALAGCGGRNEAVICECVRAHRRLHFRLSQTAARGGTSVNGPATHPRARRTAPVLRFRGTHA